MLTVVADPATIPTRGSRVRVIPDQKRVEALCAAKGAAGFNALMVPTIGQLGVVVGCDRHGDFLVKFELDADKAEAGAGLGVGVGMGKAGLAASASSLVSGLLAPPPPRLPVSFYYPPQALQLVGGAEPAMNARVRVRASYCWDGDGRW